MERLPISNMDYTTRDYEGFRTLMIQKLQELMPEYTDLRQSDAGIVIIELNAMCLDILSYYLDSIANECFLVTAEQRSNIMKFCKMLGYTPRFATSAKYLQVFERTNTSEELTISAGTKVKTYSSNPDAQIFFTTATSVTIPVGAVGNEKDADGKYLYAVECIHGLYVNNEELISASDGAENQTYHLKYAPALIDSTFRVYVSEHQGSSEAWSRVKSFAGSKSTSKVYTLEINDYNETSVVFGDDVFGMCPPENSLITCTYYVGGGDIGNVGVGAISELEDNIASISKTYNVEQLEYGYDQESLDEIKVNAPVAHRNIWGALTCDDFAGVLEVYFPDVKDAEAKKASEDWTEPEVDDIFIYIMTNDEIQRQPENDFFILGNLSEKYYNDENGKFKQLTDKIQKFFSSDTDYVEIESGEGLDSGRKLVGMRDIYLKHSVFAQLNVEYKLMVHNYYDVGKVSKQIDSYLFNFFKLGNLKFGEYISFQDLMYKILETSGIEGIRYLSLSVAGDKDDRGEIHNDLFSYISNDLLIPEKGTMFVLTGLSRSFLDTQNSNSGGGTVGG